MTKVNLPNVNDCICSANTKQSDHAIPQHTYKKELPMFLTGNYNHVTHDSIVSAVSVPKESGNTNNVNEYEGSEVHVTDISNCISIHDKGTW